MTFVIQKPLVLTGLTQVNIDPTADMVDCQMIEIINDSSFAFNTVLPGGKQSYMAPQSIKFFAGSDWYGDAIKIFVLTVMTGDFSGLPQKLIVLGFRKDEQTPPDGTVQDISKAVIIGNPVTVANMQVLQNDGAGSGTTLIETTVAGQSVSNQKVTNDGVWSLGIIIGGVITNFFVSKVVDPILQLGAVGKTVEVMGALQVDGAFSTANLSVTNLNAAGTISVAGLTTVSNINVGGTATVTGAASLSSNVTVGGTLGVTGLTSVSNINVSGTSSHTGLVTVSNLNVGGTATVTGSATLSSNTSVGGTLGVTGLTSVSNMNVSGTSSHTGLLTASNVTATGSVNVTGNIESTANSVIAFDSFKLVNAAGTLIRSFANIQIGDDDTHIYNNPANGNLHFTKSDLTTNQVNVNDTTGWTFVTTVSSTQAVTLGSTLAVTGLTTVSNINVGGTSTHTGLVTVSNINVGGTSTITGVATLSSNATVGGTLGVSGITTIASNLALSGGASNKIGLNNIVQGSIFSGSSSSTTANQTFNHNFSAANGNPLAAYLIDITGTQPAMQFTIVSFTATQITFKANATGSFTGFALRA